MGTPEWVGWLVLGLLFGGFGVLTWWLLFSPLKVDAPPSPAPAARFSQLPKGEVGRGGVAVLVFISGLAFVVGTTWDELWHRMLGGFGEDFLWPPHLLMYASLGLNLLFAVGGIALALRGRGGLRQRFRAEPLLSLLGLIAAYQMASIPSDLLWHEIIGPDITAWSLPHLLLVATTAATWLVGLALARSAQPAPRWRLLTERVSGLEVLSLGYVTLATVILLQIGVTEWDFMEDGLVRDSILSRPSWSYPVVVLAIGVATAHLALHATRCVGAATAVALAVVLVRLITVNVNRALLDAGPTLGSPLMLLLPAVALDLWYATRRVKGGTVGDWLGGCLLYSFVFLLVGVPYAQVIVGVPGLDPLAIVQCVVIGVLAGAVAGLASRDVGDWAAQLGRAARG
jgi:hypothetical protein